MSEPTATVGSGPEAAKPRRGRPPKTAHAATDRELIQTLASTVADLKKELAARNVQADIPSIELADIKIAEGPTRPKAGTIIEVGKNPDGTSVTRKVPFNRSDLEAASPPVTFIPRRSVPMMIQRVRYDFVAEREITVPADVKEEYERRMKAQFPDVASRYPSMTPQQDYEMKERAKRGLPAWSPLAYFGTGLDVTMSQEEAPAEPVKQ